MTDHELNDFSSTKAEAVLTPYKKANYLEKLSVNNREQASAIEAAAKKRAFSCRKQIILTFHIGVLVADQHLATGRPASIMGSNANTADVRRLGILPIFYLICSKVTITRLSNGTLHKPHYTSH